jgi:hypothetical protein
MKVELKNIVRKDFPIYYRRLYSGTAVIGLGGKAVEVPLDFQIEHKPTGEIETAITSMGEVDYPVVTLQKELKKTIEALDASGKLPD